MNYQQFVVKVKEALSLSLSENLELQIHSALKNNGKERVGITITDKNINVSPTIYLEEYYDQFQNGYPLEEIAERILHIYREVKFDHTWHVETVKDFNIIQSKIVYKLILAEKNEVLLQRTPHVTYLDFAIVFYILFEVSDNGTATIPITNELLELWNTDLQEIYEIACENTKRLLPATFKPMRVVIEEILGNQCNNTVLEDDMMFVLSNPLRSFGAASILYEGTLADVGKQLGENYYILPSSIHEVIIVPESKSPTLEDLNDMVMEINETQVDVEEVLSEHVYYYDCTEMNLSVKSSE